MTTLPRFSVDLGNAMDDAGVPASVSWKSMCNGKLENGKCKVLSVPLLAANGGTNGVSSTAAKEAALAAGGGGDAAAAAVAALEGRLGLGGEGRAVGGSGGDVHETGDHLKSSGSAHNAANSNTQTSNKNKNGHPHSALSMRGVIAKYESMCALGQHSRHSDGTQDGGSQQPSTPSKNSPESSPGQKEGGKKGGGGSNKGKGRKNLDEFYDTDDSFIDDEELYEECDVRAGDEMRDTKYDGFFVNAGSLETTINEKAVAKLAEQEAAHMGSLGKRKKGAGIGFGTDGPPSKRHAGGTGEDSETHDRTIEEVCEQLNLRLSQKPRLPERGIKIKNLEALLKAAADKEKMQRKLATGKQRTKLPLEVTRCLADIGALSAQLSLREGKLNEQRYKGVLELGAVKHAVELLDIPLEPINTGIRRYIYATVNGVKARRKDMLAGSEALLKELKQHVDDLLGDAGAEAWNAAIVAADAVLDKQSQGDSDFQGKPIGATSDPQQWSAEALDAASAASLAVLEAAGVKFEWDTKSETLLVESAMFLETRIAEERQIEANFKNVDCSLARLVLGDPFFNSVRLCFPPGVVKDIASLRVKLNSLKWNKNRRRKNRMKADERAKEAAHQEENAQEGLGSIVMANKSVQQ